MNFTFYNEAVIAKLTGKIVGYVGDLESSPMIDKPKLIRGLTDACVVVLPGPHLGDSVGRDVRLVALIIILGIVIIYLQRK